MKRSASNAFVITPQYPFSYPRDSDSVQSSCTMDVLIPTGQTTYLKNYRSNLPTGTVLGVCRDSIHIALPKTVIESTYCTEMDEIKDFTGDFKIRFYGTWTDQANGAILQITGENPLSSTYIYYKLALMYNVCCSLLCVNKVGFQNYALPSKIYISFFPVHSLLFVHFTPQ